MSLNKGEHTLGFLRAVEKVTADIKSIALQNEETIEEVNPAREINITLPDGYYPYTLSFAPTNKEFDFYFELRGAKDVNGSIATYTILYRPQSTASISERLATENVSATLTHFKEWISIIAAYNKINLTPKEQFTAQSAEQFYQYFDFVDEDAKTHPFNDDKQLLLYQLLEVTKNKVEQLDAVNQQEVDTIVQEIKLLQEAIPNITKSTAAKRLSKIFAKMKSISMKLAADMFDVTKKEAMKALLYSGLEHGSHGIDAIAQLLS